MFSIFECLTGFVTIAFLIETIVLIGIFFRNKSEREVPSHRLNSVQSIKLDKIFDYSFDWFKFHAKQRQTGFQISLVFFGVGLAAITTAIVNEIFCIAWFLSIIMAFFSIAFLIIESRNEKLVEFGKNALFELEEKFDCLEDSKCRIQHISKNHRDDFLKCFIFTHQVWYKLIYIIFCIIFISIAWGIHFWSAFLNAVY